jgi:peptide-methionine (R)-S-oxide reductase
MNRSKSHPKPRTLILIAGWLVLTLVPRLAFAQDADKPSDKPSMAKDDESKAGTSASKDTAEKTNKTAEPEPEFVIKTPEEWRRVLTNAQFAVTRMKATEPAFTGKYATGHYRGTFLCVCCGAPLFSADHKFDSGTGWPSFWRAINDKAIDHTPDNTEAEPRIEVTCRRCGAHLGHVFDDGPAPTGLRFCINSVSLKLKPPTPTDSDAAKPATTTAKSKAKSKVTSKAKSTASSKSRPKTTPPKPPADDTDSNPQ